MKIFQKVRFYSDDGSGKNANFLFRSEKSVENFLEKYEFIGGFRRFNYDWVGETPARKYLVIPASDKGFEIVYRALYNRSPFKD